MYIVFFWKWKKRAQDFYPDNRPFIFGHRGSPEKSTENTIASFEQAIEQGVDGLELDIRLSRDKRLVIFHDPSLERLAGIKKKIKHLTFDEMKEVLLEQNQTIPLLGEVVQLIPKIKALNIEIKSDWLFGGQGILSPLIKFLNKHDIDDKCIVSSFNPLILWRLKLQRPQTIIGYLYNRNRLFHSWSNLVWMCRIRPDNLHIHYSLLDSWVVNWARNKGMKINSYTINDKKVFDNAKINGVFTDNIEYLK